LRALLVYREQIRSLMIENQLDDRHDLRGNSLYRLRFDATVLPGGNTRASAKVTISVLPPDDLFGFDKLLRENQQDVVAQESQRFGALRHPSGLTPTLDAHD